MSGEIETPQGVNLAPRGGVPLIVSGEIETFMTIADSFPFEDTLNRVW